MLKEFVILVKKEQIHTFSPVVETYKHITNAKTQETEVEKPSKSKKAKETEVIK